MLTRVLLALIAHVQQILSLYHQKSSYVNLCMAKMSRYEKFTMVYKIITRWKK